MTQTQIIVLVVVVGALIALALGFSGGGPRVTTIETRREPDKDGDDA